MTVFELMQALGEMPLDRPVHFWSNGKRQDIVEVRDVGDCVDLYENEENDATQNLQVVWEQLNGALYDLEHGDPADAIPAIEDCIKRLEALGVGETA